MATDVIMPALGMAQETGRLVSWLKREGERVEKGEPIMEVETDKATVEIEAPASGVLSRISAEAGDQVPVGQTIGLILSPGEAQPAPAGKASSAGSPPQTSVEATPVARRMAAEHGLDLAEVRPGGGRVGKEDVSAYLAAQDAQARRKNGSASSPEPQPAVQSVPQSGRALASPKARRLAGERGLDLLRIAGSGPVGAVLAGDVEHASSTPAPQPAGQESLATVWRIMAERMTASWTSAPHFYLLREVDARGLVEMRARITPSVEKHTGQRPSYTDLLVKLAAAALRDHPEVNARWAGERIERQAEINIGLAVGVEDGLVVPVIQGADTLGVGEIARRRAELVERANARRLHPEDIAGGSFTITNLGMFNVDAFLPVLNPPQAAILAVGRIAERVAAVDGQPVVRPEMILSLACDHRTVDGLRAAKFLDDLVQLIEEPWGVLV